MATAEMIVEEAPENTQESNGDNMVVKTAHSVVLAGLGAAAYGKEEFATVFERLVEKGEVTEKENRERFGEMFDRRRKDINVAEDKIEGILDERIESVLNTMNIPSKSDIESLNKKIASLSRKVSALDKKLDAEQKAA